jgi:hypothetical protein
MRINSADASGLWAGVLITLLLSTGMSAKDKEPSTAVQGTVFLIDKDTSTIMVDTKSGLRRVVIYGPDTKFKHGRNDKGQESAVGKVMEAEYISCTGKSDDGARLVAQECVHRARK